MLRGGNRVVRSDAGKLTLFLLMAPFVLWIVLLIVLPRDVLVIAGPRLEPEPQSSENIGA